MGKWKFYYYTAALQFSSYLYRAKHQCSSEKIFTTLTKRYEALQEYACFVT